MRSHPSYSSLSTYDRCPAAFRACYINGDPGATNGAVGAGKLAHELMARYGAHCYKHKRTSDLEEARNMLVGYPQDVQDMMEDFLENWRWEFGGIVFKGAAPVEQKLSARLPGGLEFTSHLDLLQRYDDAATVQAVDVASAFGDDDEPDLGDGALWVITDFASHWYDKETQLRWYAWQVQQNWPGARVIEGRVQPFGGFGFQGEAVRFDGDLSYVGHELQALCDRIAADDQYEPDPGPACLSCFHRLACPCHDSATLQRICGDTAEGMMRKMLWHEAQADMLKPLLKEHVKLQGPVACDGYVFEGRRSSSIVSRFPATLAQDLAALGLTELDLRNGISKQQVKKIAKGLDEEQRAKFDALFAEQPSGSETFKAYKANGGSDE